MAKIVPLNSTNHKDLKVSPNCVIDVVKNQHIVNIRVAEISKASACMPVFLNKYEDSDSWAISSVTSLEMNKNLFVVDDKWTVNYVPNVMRTYPFFVVVGQRDGNGVLTVGIDEEDKAFNTKDGVGIFDKDGKSTPAMSSVLQLLEADVQGKAHTVDFVKTLEKFDLIHSLIMRVKYQNGQVNSVSGLKSVNEKKLQELSDDEFIELRKTGFLGPIYALILSVYQLNELMKRHNQTPGVEPIVQVKMEPAEETTAEPAVEPSEPTQAKKVTKKRVANKASTKTTVTAKEKALAAAKLKAAEAAKTKTPVKAKTTTKVTKKVAKKK